MQRTMVIMIKDDQRTQTAIDIAAVKLLDGIQETHLTGVGLRVNRPARFCINVDILQPASDVNANIP